MTDKALQFELSPLFQAVSDALQYNRAALNQADQLNGNHGDHMVEIFEIAARAAQEKRQADLAQSMAYAGELLAQQVENGSAQVYARGLAQMAEQFSKHEISLEELVLYIRSALAEEGQGKQKSASARSGEVLKALMAGLAGWGAGERGQVSSDSALDMAALFELGMAYMQAKQRGGSRVEVLADAAASASPLSSPPHRYQSGKLAIQALLLAIKDLPDPGPAG